MAQADTGKGHSAEKHRDPRVTDRRLGINFVHGDEILQENGLKILHIDDSELDAELVRCALERAYPGCHADWVSNFPAYRQALRTVVYDLILSDYALPDCNGLQLLAEARAQYNGIPFILVTGALGDEPAIETVKAGVTDYILKSNLERLQTAIPRALEQTRREQERNAALQALRLSEERFDLAVRGSGAGIWDWSDVTKNEMWFSPRIYELLGYPEGENEKPFSHLNELIHAEDMPATAKALAAHFSGQQPYDVEYRVRHRNGHYLWLRCRGKAIFDNGVPRRMAGYVQDISERKKAQRELLRHQQDLLRAQEVAHLGCWTLDIPAQRLYWTSVLYKIFGFTPETFDRTLAAARSRIHPEDRGKVEAAWQEALKSGRLDCEYRLLIEGQIRYVHDVGEIEFDSQRLPCKAIGVVHDLTEQRHAEVEKRKSDERYRAITNAAQDAIIMVDSQGQITLWNPAAQKIFGFSAEEALGRNIHQFLAPENLRPHALRAMQEFARTGQGEQINRLVEVEGLTRQGNLIPLEITLSAVHQDEGWQAIGLLRDISERKAAEEQRRSLESQLRQAQKLEALGTLAGGISHDFNNILASILGYTSLVERRLPAESREKLDLQEVLKAAGRAKQLVGQILTFCRKSEVKKEPVFPDLVLKEALTLLKASLPATIEISCSLNSNGEAVLGDSTQIHQVIMNLCTNAYHAMPHGGTLSISLQKRHIGEGTSLPLAVGNYLEILITDTGCGIPAEFLPKIFDPYFTTKPVDSGTGLGLSVVKGIIEGMKGFIGVESRVNHGTRFLILLPCYQDIHPQEAAPSTDQSTGGSEHLLFVDDELNLVLLGKKFLEGLGYRVSTQCSSLDALELIRTRPQEFDLVITDQAMPQMSGMTLAKELKKIAPNLPVILCSGLYVPLEPDLLAETSIRKFLLKTDLLDKMPGILREVLDG